MERRLYRSGQDKRLFGICGGIAQFLNIDSTLVRVGVVILTVCTGIPILIYLLLAMIMPKEPRFSYAGDGFDVYERPYAQGYSQARMNDLDSEIDRLEKRALVQEVQRLRAELGKYKNI
ncbi:PspC domain-containing protein [Brevibacillus choshinensis]|uniref:PspC domain-containing protein n=1 Tax=Brevibacillus choshinensis TaxID=54911 RepID=A0ABX7FIL8_BRECH|nr:PspC domain-containing protein [Brevibacillus choshinensis]QRG66073.1 PspC domain-containing protein [Brevibacillus choshinensis]